MYFLLQEGNRYNVPLPTYYVESEDELNELEDAPAGTVAKVNEIGNFHVMMKHSSGEWNSL